MVPWSLSNAVQSRDLQTPWKPLEIPRISQDLPGSTARSGDELLRPPLPPGDPQSGAGTAQRGGGSAAGAALDGLDMGFGWSFDDWLVVNGCHQLYFPRNIGLLIIPIDELIFFRGVQTTKQMILDDSTRVTSEPIDEDSLKYCKRVIWPIDSSGQFSDQPQNFRVHYFKTNPHHHLCNQVWLRGSVAEVPAGGRHSTRHCHCKLQGGAGFRIWRGMGMETWRHLELWLEVQGYVHIT